MNNYHVYEEIGKGKYSNVYKGRKKKSIEYVAVKGLEKSRLKKLLNEVKCNNYIHRLKCFLI
jgi:serine/threonine-protein kinase ULK4